VRNDESGDMKSSASEDARHGEPVRPFDAIMLDVGDKHWLYVEQIGSKDGAPAVFLHGGPGSGSQHAHRALFDQKRSHGILFDQRGAGRSHPYLSLEANTTQHLIADIERIREHLGIERWLVVGGSWGSTLALAYAQAFPERVTGLVLRAIFLGTAQEARFAFVDGPKLFRPDLYADFISLLPEAERDDALGAYVRRLADPDPNVHSPAARTWNAYERALSKLAPGQTRLVTETSSEGRLPPTPFVEAHYIRHDFFLKPEQLLRGASKLNGIPGVMVQGRYDLLCPPKSAYALHEAWPGSRLQIIENAGHCMSEPGVAAAMANAVRELTS
jgi:proline iminopeptidase